MNSFKVKSQFGDYLVEFKSFKDDLTLKGIPVIDKNVWELYKENSVFKTLNDPIIIEINEENKSLKSIEKLSRKLIQKGANKESHLLAIGGGITQELVSFLASIFYRGIKWSFIPTTLLSQVDSCLGGKNSINIDGFKNMLGTFYPPRKITIINDFFKSLEQSHLDSGYFEMLKIHLLSGKEEFDKFKSLSLEEKIYNSLILKKKIVEQDEKDKKERWKLNLGHTVGHALEASSQSSLPHGIAVGFGMLWELEISKGLKLIKDEDYSVIKNQILDRVSKIEIPNYDHEKFKQALLKDKKNSEGNINFILFKSIGEVTLKSIPPEEISEVLSFIS